MRVKDTLRRIEPAAFAERPPQWDMPPLACVQAAMAAALQGRTVAAGEVRAAIAAHYARLGARITPAAVLLGVDAMRLQSVIGKKQIIAFSHPGDLLPLLQHVGDGRSGVWHRGFYQGVEYLDAYDEIDFKATLPVHEPAVVHLASPSTATGVALSAKEWLRWVRYAEQTGMTIFHDASLGAYAVANPGTALVTPGAAACVLETVSLAPAGLAGAVYTLVADEFRADNGAGNPFDAAVALRNYLVEPELSPVLLAGLAAFYSEAGQTEWAAYRAAVLRRAQTLRAILMAEGIACWGGEDAPVLWAETTDKKLLALLRENGAECVAGTAYGPAGAGYTQIRVRPDRETIVHYSTKETK